MAAAAFRRRAQRELALTSIPLTPVPVVVATEVAHIVIRNPLLLQPLPEHRTLPPMTTIHHHLLGRIPTQHHPRTHAHTPHRHPTTHDINLLNLLRFPLHPAASAQNASGSTQRVPALNPFPPLGATRVAPAHPLPHARQLLSAQPNLRSPPPLAPTSKSRFVAAPNRAHAHLAILYFSMSCFLCSLYESVVSGFHTHKQFILCIRLFELRERLDHSGFGAGRVEAASGGTEGVVEGRDGVLRGGRRRGWSKLSGVAGGRVILGVGTPILVMFPWMPPNGRWRRAATGALGVARRGSSLCA